VALLRESPPQWTRWRLVKSAGQRTRDVGPVSRFRLMNSCHVAGHQAFHPFHFGPRPFPFGHPQDPLGFKLSGKWVFPVIEDTRARTSFIFVATSLRGYLLPAWGSPSASRHVSPSIDN